MTTTPYPGFQPSHTRGEWRLIAIIFGLLIVLILIPLLRWRSHETHRPSLSEIRVVAATTTDPVFREGARDIGPEEEVSLAVALRLEYPGKGSQWLAPVERLELDGVTIDHVKTDSWPETDRSARTFWFTLESPYLGGIIDGDSEKLNVRPFLAPELGHGFMAYGEPESHADDGINLGDTLIPTLAGTTRIYARVEVVTDNGSSRPLFSASSLGPDNIGDPSMVRISRDLENIYPGINSAAGRLFRLPGFEGNPNSGWDATDPCNRLIATSSHTFAAMAVTGHCDGGFPDLRQTGQLTVTDSALQPALQWQRDIQPGDVLKQGNHWLILISDDGNGILDGPDLVAHSWHRPGCLQGYREMTEQTPIARLSDVSIAFPRHGTAQEAVVDRVSLAVNRGERVGLIGASGSGKSLTALALLGLVPPPGAITGGMVEIYGTEILSAPLSETRPLRGGTIAMVFQEAESALNPVLTIGDHLEETIRCHRPDEATRWRPIAVALLKSVDLEPVRTLRSHPHRLSGGQRQRALLAIALAGQPDLLIADEPTSSLDVLSQADILRLLDRLSQNRDEAHPLALLLISHDIGVVSALVDRIIVMLGGMIIEESPIQDFLEQPLHPYSRTLVTTAQGGSLSTTKPNETAPPTEGCPFAPRCPHREPQCLEVRPELVSLGSGLTVRCPIVTHEIRQ